MSSLRLDVSLVPPTDAVAQQALEASRLLAAGDRANAERLYREAAAMPGAGASGLVNLAALAIGLGDAQAARGHAMRVVQADRTNADAWLNLGAASWHVEMRRDGAQCTHRALELSPGMEAAALNLNLMHQAVGKPAQARGVLAAALPRNP
ncbi:MAG TPA: hypothetical protein VN205_11890, partial [Thermomonas sp.]|nr:hypothetical protein [Thermomonas sp.]